MTATLHGPALRTMPQPEPLTATLLDTADVSEGIEWMEPANLYTSLNCLPIPGLTSNVCVTPITLPTFSASPQVVSAIRFVTLIGYQCRPLGESITVAEDFNRVTDQRESAAVEQALQAIRFTGGQGGAAATDLTPAAGAVNANVGLAILEGDAAKKYVGRPTMHASRTIASLLTDNPGWITTGNTMRTGLGSKFVAGAGYEANIGPSAAAAAAGESWLYATGEVTVHRSPRRVLPPQLDRQNNIEYILSQRIYVVDVDCYVSAVRVKIA